MVNCRDPGKGGARAHAVDRPRGKSRASRGALDGEKKNRLSRGEKERSGSGESRKKKRGEKPGTPSQREKGRGGEARVAKKLFGVRRRGKKGAAE